MKKFFLSLAVFVTLSVVWLGRLSSPALAIDPPSTDGITNPAVVTEYGSNAAGAQSGSLVYRIIGRVAGFTMLIGSLLLLLQLVEGGIAWVSSGGDSGKVQKARDRILHSVVGLIVLSAAFAIWLVVKQFLGITEDFSVLFPSNNGAQDGGGGSGGGSGGSGGGGGSGPGPGGGGRQLPT